MTGSPRFITSHSSIVVCDAGRATTLCENPATRDQLTGVISIADPPPFEQKRPRGKVLAALGNLAVLNFRDTDDATLINGPTEAIVRDILTFAKTVEERYRWVVGREDGRSAPRKLLVHCMAGRSRSTAAAFILLVARQPPGEPGEPEQRAMSELLRACERTPLPNMLMCKIADDVLGRGGRLVKVAQSQNDDPQDAEADANKPVTGTALLAAIRRGEL